MKKILLIEDDPLIIRMYQKKLSEDGFQVLTAFNGESGLKIAKNERPDLIFLDLVMPIQDGVATLKLIKADPALAPIPVIMLTNLNHRETNADKAKALGALDYLTKSETNLRALSDKAKEVLGA